MTSVIVYESNARILEVLRTTPFTLHSAQVPVGIILDFQDDQAMDALTALRKSGIPCVPFVLNERMEKIFSSIDELTTKGQSNE